MSFFPVRLNQSDLAFARGTLEGFAKSNDGSAGNNFCQELCMIVPREEGGSGDQTRVNPQCDDLRRVLAALKEEERSPPESKPLVIPRCGRLLFSGVLIHRKIRCVVWSNLANLLQVSCKLLVKEARHITSNFLARGRNH